MPNFFSDIGQQPARAPRFGGVIGRRAKFTAPAGLVAADTVTLFKVPKGAVPLYGVLRNDILATTVTVDIGWGGGTIDSVAEDPDAFIDGFNAASAGDTEFNLVAGMIDRAPLDAERPLLLTYVTLATPTTGADFVVSFMYLLTA
ncbi:hypothetical protein N9980_01295 [bacterium]|nr:hypothetical protein [bacterium]